MLRKLVLIALFVALPVYGLAAVVLPERCPDGDGNMHIASHSAAVATPCDQPPEAHQGGDDSHLCKDGLKCQSRVWSEPTVQIVLQSGPFTADGLDNFHHPIVPRRPLSAVWRPPRSA